ncbi:MAG: antitoxin Xre/MbcA/ParS toxin-binding domain-containing protein [Pseudomonas sp.]
MATRKTAQPPVKSTVKKGQYAKADSPVADAVAEEAGLYQYTAPTAPTAPWPTLYASQASGIDEFHAITQLMEGMTDEQQVSIIRHGLSASVARSLGQTFAISVAELAKVLLVSESTLTRKSRDNALLDPSATERMMRIASITALATDVFENSSQAIAWMTRANVALGGEAPLSLCDNDISAKQVRRVLRAIEYGGVV